MTYIPQAIECKNVTVTEPDVITCTDPTAHYASGCDLLLHYDFDGDGVINVYEEIGAAHDDRDAGSITEEEYMFVWHAMNAGSINAYCPGCYEEQEPEITCTTPTTHYASGCDLLLAYDTDGDGIISGGELTQAVADKDNGIITAAEALFVHTVWWNGGQINTGCPGCYSGFADIVATNITVAPPSCEAPCNIDISITWANNGTVAGSFDMGYTVNGTLYTMGSMTLQPGESYTATAVLTDTPSGNYVICPSPNP